MVWYCVLMCQMLKQTVLAQDSFIIQQNEFQEGHNKRYSLVMVSPNNQFETVVSRDDVPLEYCSEIWNQSFILCMAFNIQRVPWPDLWQNVNQNMAKRNVVLYDIKRNIWREITTVHLEDFAISSESSFNRVLLITKASQMFSCDIQGLVCVLFELPQQSPSVCCALVNLPGSPMRLFATENEFSVCLRYYSINQQVQWMLIPIDRTQTREKATNREGYMLSNEKMTSCEGYRITKKYLGTWLDLDKKRDNEKKLQQLQSLNESIIEFCMRYQDERLQNIILFSIIALFVASTSFFSYTFFSK